MFLSKPVGEAMKRVLLAGAALVALAAMQPALAADAPYWAPPSAAAPFSWNGFYIGASVGGGWQFAQPVELLTDSILLAPNNFGQATAASRGTIGDIGARGWFAGGQAGYNWQYGSSWLVGLEADLQYSRISHSITGIFTNPSGTVPISGSANFNMDWFGTVRGRFGMTAESWLVYATGGLAYGHISYDLSAIEIAGGSRAPLYQSALSASDTRFGYVVGAGIEYAFTPNLTMRGEYQYINLGTIGAAAPVTPVGVPSETATLKSINAVFQTIRLGLNWKL